MKKILFTLWMLGFFNTSMFGKIILPSVFSDNMVLQQNSIVAIWAWSDPCETIKIVTGWNTKDTVKVKADNTSAWKTTISTNGSGGGKSTSLDPLPPRRFKRKNEWGTGVGIAGISTNYHTPHKTTFFALIRALIANSRIRENTGTGLKFLNLTMEGKLLLHSLNDRLLLERVKR